MRVLFLVQLLPSFSAVSFLHEAEIRGSACPLLRGAESIISLVTSSERVSGVDVTGILMIIDALSFEQTPAVMALHVMNELFTVIKTYNRYG